MVKFLLFFCHFALGAHTGSYAECTYVGGGGFLLLCLQAVFLVRYVPLGSEPTINETIIMYQRKKPPEEKLGRIIVGRSLALATGYWHSRIAEATCCGGYLQRYVFLRLDFRVGPVGLVIPNSTALLEG